MSAAAVLVIIGCGGKTSLESISAFDGDAGAPRPVDPGATSETGRNPPPSESNRRMPLPPPPTPGEDPTGSCNAQFCPDYAGRGTCCIAPNGPCGVRYGGDCVTIDQVPPPPDLPPQTQPSAPPSPATCDPGFCPPVGRGTPCCLTPAGPCGTDWGGGCTPEMPLPPTRCDPAFCPVSGAGTPCCTPDETCGLDVGFGCDFGSCSEPIDACMAQVGCPCLCQGCQCQWLDCMGNDGCRKILDCALATGCSGAACYSPDACLDIIDAVGGPAGVAATAALDLDSCVADRGCRSACGPLL